MSNRYRMLGLALGGWLIAATGVADQPAGSGEPQQEQPSQPIQEASPPVPPTPILVIEPVQPVLHEQPCKPGEDNRDSDLCAQWKAADATADAALWAMLGAIIGLISVIGIFITVWYTRRAAIAAAEAAKASIDAAECARDQYMLSSRIWVLWNETEANIANGNIIIGLRVTNFGLLPAKITTHQEAIYFDNIDATEKWLPSDTKKQSKLVLVAPNQILRVATIAAPMEQAVRAYQNHCAIIACIEFDYMTIPGGQWEERHSVLLSSSYAIRAPSQIAPF
jgi:hypothetical protein